MAGITWTRYMNRSMRSRRNIVREGGDRRSSRGRRGRDR